MATHSANDQKAKEELLEAKVSNNSKEVVNTITQTNLKLYLPQQLRKNILLVHCDID